MGAAMFLKTRQIPVWTACIGTAVDVKDVYVTARLNQSFLFAGQTGTLVGFASKKQRWNSLRHRQRHSCAPV